DAETATEFRGQRVPPGRPGVARAAALVAVACPSMERLPARAPAPAVGRALVAPVPLGVGVAAGGLTLLAAGVVPAVVVALVAWLVAAGARLLRRAGPRSERIDPFAVNEPWRRFVSGALQARAR